MVRRIFRLTIEGKGPYDIARILSYTMLLSKEAERKTYQVASNMTYLELSTVPTYMDEFVAACFIPHTDTSMFPSVSQQ